VVVEPRLVFVGIATLLDKMVECLLAVAQGETQNVEVMVDGAVAAALVMQTRKSVIHIQTSKEAVALVGMALSL
jgi:uncharacterized Fe-S cluster-containing radical SAM superfamily enzyme